MPVNGIFDVFDMLSIYIIYKLIVSNNTWMIMRLSLIHISEPTRLRCLPLS
ncbi:hypothetical protein, partial [Escherichia coli]|uniref:hypothetical protein n=1 Tax=Escherichia coli TaxID=562 RepID=UPI004038CB55